MTTDAVFFPLDTTFGCTLGLLHLYTDTCIWMQVFGCMWVRRRARWLQKQPWDPLEFSQNVSFSWFLRIKLLIGLEVLARISDIQISAGYIVPEMTSCGQSWELRWPLVLKLAGATCSCHTWVLDSKKSIFFVLTELTASLCFQCLSKAYRATSSPNATTKCVIPDRLSNWPMVSWSDLSAWASPKPNDGICRLFLSKLSPRSSVTNAIVSLAPCSYCFTKCRLLLKNLQTRRVTQSRSRRNQVKYQVRHACPM